MNTPKLDIKQEITNQIIALIEQGGLKFASNFVKQIPFNASTGQSYRGINILILAHAQFSNGFKSNSWLTFNQARALGGNVRKGSKGVRCAKLVSIDSKEPQITGDNKEAKKIQVMNGFVLFNTCQIDNLPESITTQSDSIGDNESIESAENILLNSGAVIEYGFSPVYSPSMDKIGLPNRDAFTSPAEFYSTAMHELTHWTGHKNRLNRDFTGRFGSQSYAFEELVAELGSAFLNANIGLTGETIQNNAAYIDNWLTVLRKDKNAIFTAASKASEATDFILNLSKAHNKVAA